MIHFHHQQVFITEMEFSNNDNLIQEIHPVVFEELGRILNKVCELQEPADAAADDKPPVIEIQRVVDSAVHLLGSKQDLVHTAYRSFENSEEWDLVVFDGHGSMNNKNPYHDNKHENYNLVLAILQDLISKGELDTILARDIYGEESPAMYLQRFLSKKCVEYSQSMILSGATMSLIQIRHDFLTKKITVNVETVGDSPVTIYCNGEQVLSSEIHDYTNVTEMKRLADEKRLAFTPTIPSNSFKVLDEKTLCVVKSKYICVRECDLAMTQSLGHIDYKTWTKTLGDEKGIFGLAPYKATMVFEETDELNIKAYSDGVSDIVVDTLPCDKEFLKTSNATETANFAKSRWEQKWFNVLEKSYREAVVAGTLDQIKRAEHMFGNGGADDVCCVSWIQTMKR